MLHEMWKKLLADIRRDDIDEQRAEKVLRNITSFQTTEQFIRMFTHIEEVEMYFFVFYFTYIDDFRLPVID